MRPRPLMPLLFRQTLCLAGVLGATACLWPPCVAFLVVLLWLDRRSRDCLRFFAVLLAFALGYGYAAFCEKPAPPVPDWISERHPAHLVADVISVFGLYNGRVRIVLENVYANGNALPGRLSWTWENPPERPTAGSRIAATLRLLPLTGFRNTDVSNSGESWQRQGVWWRAWTKGNLASYRVLGESPGHSFRAFGAQLREAWRLRLEDTLKNLYLPEECLSSKKAVQESASREGWGFLPALLFGDRSRLDVGDVERITKAGLVHSIALSGQHLAVAGLLAGVGLWLVGRMRPACFLAVPRPKLVLLASLLPALGYLWLGNAPPSLCRAALMLGFWALFCLRNRTTAFPDALLATLVCMVLADPAVLGDIGALLSFASVAGIALVSPLLTEIWSGTETPFHAGRFPRIAWNVRQTLVSLLLCSVAVQLATLPVVLSVFGRVPVLFALNLLWLPTLGFLVLPAAFIGLLALVAGMNFAAEPLLALASKPCAWLVSGLARLDAAGWLEAPWCPRPHWTSSIGWMLLVVALAWTAGRKPPFPAKWKQLVALGAFLIACGPAIWGLRAFDDRIRLRVLDVGQGQAVLVEGARHFRLLADGGGFNSSRFDTGRDILRPVLTANAPLALDVMALTHPDTDHLRGLLFLARHARIKLAVLPDGPASQTPSCQELEGILLERGVHVRHVRHGDTLDLGQGLRLEILGFGASPLTGDNNQGIALRLTHNGRGLVMIPGDAGRQALNSLVRSGAPLSAEVLVAPHHGSGASVSESFISAVGPRETLVSCGVLNQWGFPSKKLREAMSARNIPIRDTAESGELDVFWKPDQTAKSP